MKKKPSTPSGPVTGGQAPAPAKPAAKPQGSYHPGYDPRRYSIPSTAIRAGTYTSGLFRGYTRDEVNEWRDNAKRTSSDGDRESLYQYYSNKQRMAPAPAPAPAAPAKPATPATPAPAPGSGNGGPQINIPTMPIPGQGPAPTPIPGTGTQTPGGNVLGNTPNPVTNPLPGANNQTGKPAQGATLQNYMAEQMKLLQAQMENQRQSYQKMFDAIGAQAELAKQTQAQQKLLFEKAQMEQLTQTQRAAQANLNAETRFGEYQADMSREYTNQTNRAQATQGLLSRRRGMMGQAMGNQAGGILGTARSRFGTVRRR